MHRAEAGIFHLVRDAVLAEGREAKEYEFFRRYYEAAGNREGARLYSGMGRVLRESVRGCIAAAAAISHDPVAVSRVLSKEFAGEARHD